MFTETKLAFPMKKSATLLLFSCFALLTFGQAPFTITADNFPVYGTQNYNGPNNYNNVNLTPAVNGSWNLSVYHGDDIAQNDYQVETLDFYTQAGIDVYITDFKNLTPNLGYLIDSEFDFNPSGVFEKGFYVTPQAYSLSALTGNNADSLTFPLQGAILASGRQVMKFPATYTTAWNSQSRRVVDFNLTVTAAGLNKTPCKHVYTTFRSDSILGWGNMRVYANGAPSIPYNVLINRSIQYSVDSFFVGGAPAPLSLLNAFGIVQGQQTGKAYRHSAYREGHSTALAIVLYPNTNFGTPSAIYVDTDNLTTTATSNPANQDFTTLVYPNPCPEGVLNLQISGNAPNLRSFEIIDLQGRVLQSGSTDLQGNSLQLTLDGSIANGAYFLHLVDDKKQTAIMEQFMLMR